MCKSFGKVHFSLLMFTALALACLFCASSAMAFRGARSMNMDPEKRISKLKTDLSLTDEQVEKIRPIVQQDMEKRQAVFEKYKTQGRDARKNMRTEMQTLGADFETQLKSVLTEEQMTKFKQMHEERRQKMMDRRGKRKQ